MSKISAIHGAIEATRDAVHVFDAIGGLVPGETRTLFTRIGLGFGEVAGICAVTVAAPGTAAGNLLIEQSVDGTNYDQVDTFPILGVNTLPFSVKIVGTYVRARFAVPVGEVYSLRFGAQLKPQTGP